MMKLSKFISILLTLSLAITLLVSSAESIEQNRARQAENSNQVIFGVDVSVLGLSIDPIVILERGLYIKPPLSYPQSGYNQEKTDQFIANYYQPGQRYRLLFGEKEIGTVTIETPERGIYLSAKVKGGKNGTLATNSSSLGPKQRSSRRAATDSEQNVALELAKKAFQQNGVPDSLLNQKIVATLMAADFDGDSNYELIGSFNIEKKTRSDPSHSLFIIIKPQNSSYRTQLIWYNKIQDPNFNEIYSKEFIDLLDLDGDSIAELITKDGYYEGKSYTIYKKQGNNWESIYSGGGGSA